LISFFNRFGTRWLSVECLVYRRLLEAMRESPELAEYDFFGKQKREAFYSSLRAISSLITTRHSGLFCLIPALFNPQLTIFQVGSGQISSRNSLISRKSSQISSRNSSISIKSSQISGENGQISSKSSQL